ncbi:MAG: hypothetical protein V1723_00295 [Candidatus Uhrbacteria bacterium]
MSALRTFIATAASVLIVTLLPFIVRATTGDEGGTAWTWGASMLLGVGAAVLPLAIFAEEVLFTEKNASSTTFLLSMSATGCAALTGVAFAWMIYWRHVNSDEASHPGWIISFVVMIMGMIVYARVLRWKGVAIRWTVSALCVVAALAAIVAHLVIHAH